MGAYYFRRPTAAELAGTGFLPEHYEEPDIGLWPENYDAWSVFTLLQGQWRCGPSGPIGLDYVAVFAELDHRAIAGEDRDDTMQALRVLESAAMTELTRN